MSSSSFAAAASAPPTTAQREITNADRNMVRNKISELLQKVDIQRNRQVDPVRICKSVEAWEEKLFVGCNGDRSVYGTKSKELVRKIGGELQALLQQQQNPPTPAVTSTPTVSQSTTNASPPKQPPLPPKHAKPPLLHQQQPPPRIAVPSIPVAKPPPPPPIAAVHYSPEADALIRDFLRQVKQALDEIHTVLRTAPSVLVDNRNRAQDRQYMAAFAQLSVRVRALKSLQIHDLKRELQAMMNEIPALRSAVDPQAVQILRHLKLLSLDQLAELDSEPFGILQRHVQIHGRARFSSNAKRASNNVGGLAPVVKLARLGEEGGMV